MNTEEIESKRKEVVEKFGEWTAHNIHLRDNIYTYDQGHPKFEDQLTGYGLHLRRIIQSVADTTNQPLSTLRVLDLACLEGGYGIELARHGAEVVGIEGREANVEKARFAKEALALDNFTVVQDDVRALSAEKYGHFDVVLCLGILYHLDVPDAFHFIERIAEVCRRVAIIDTHVSIQPNKTHVFKGREYRGWQFVEHVAGTTEKERLKSLWASLDNENSFWLSRPSLFNLLAECGFTSVYTCQNPAVPGQWLDRDTLIATKGSRQEILSTPPINAMPQEHWSEESQVGLHPGQQVAADDKRTFLKRGVGFAKRVIRKD